VKVLLAFVPLAATLVACGGDTLPAEPMSTVDSALVRSALERSIRDSAALALAEFNLPAVMETSFGQDGETVRVVESFVLSKRPRGEFAALDRKQTIYGDRSLLESMYSFENSKGELRSESEARFASLGFGSDQRSILRDLLEGRLSLREPVSDSVASDGQPIRTIHFAGDGVNGAIDLDRESLAARRVAVSREQSTIIGGYVYDMTLMLSEPTDMLRIPVQMRTSFQYERLTSGGAGVVQMDIDTARRQ
jgi:hypothetical protein